MTSARSESSEDWSPDPALVLTVRSRNVPIASLSIPDRAWVVAALTVEGWTVRAIADRLRCSLRLVQQIKAEPMAKMALHAMQTHRALLEEQAVRRLEARIVAQEVRALRGRIDALTQQRDALIDQLNRTRKARVQ